MDSLQHQAKVTILELVGFYWGKNTDVYKLYYRFVQPNNRIYCRYSKLWDKHTQNMVSCYIYYYTLLNLERRHTI